MKKLFVVIAILLLEAACVPSPADIEIMLEQTRIAQITPTEKPTSTPTKKPPTSPQSSSSSSTTLGTWKDTCAYNRTITITLTGSTYKMQEVYSDGSGQTVTLGVKNVGGETRLYETVNAAGDYMVIKSDGSLAFYDNQGFICSLP